ncbi:unnamed protein product [Durusdinium trenchii]|uniref:Uncharacterized protein n=1 Tax=Durusdinium trenchii TaxID=1381693 RepID=A0ABP0L5P9_9DINO
MGDVGNELFAVAPRREDPEGSFLVQQVQPELAPKLTGMLLQLGEAECWACTWGNQSGEWRAPVTEENWFTQREVPEGLEDHNKLAERLDEAMAILDGAHAEAAPKAKPQPEKRVDPEDGVTRSHLVHPESPSLGETELVSSISVILLAPWHGVIPGHPGGEEHGTFAELQKHYAGQYSPQEIKDAAARPAPAAPAAPAAAKAELGSGAWELGICGSAGSGSGGSTQGKRVSVQPAPAKAPKGSQDVVPRLGAWLRELRLEAYLAAANEWAEEQGSEDEVPGAQEDCALLRRQKEDPSGRRVVEVENGEAAAQAVEEMEEEGADEDEDALEEGRAGQLDTERDLAALSYVDHPEPDLPPARPAAARPCAATAAPSAARAPATSTARPAAVATAPARSGRKQGFGGYYDKGAEESQPFSMGQRAEKRVDLEDGKAKTFRELQAEYTHLYSPQDWIDTRANGTGLDLFSLDFMLLGPRRVFMRFLGDLTDVPRIFEGVQSTVRRSGGVLRREEDLPILQLGAFKSIFGSLADLIIACVFSLCGVWAHTTAQNDRLQSSIQELDLRMLVDKQHVETGASRFTVYCIQNLISQRSTSSGQLQRLVGKLREMAMGKMHWLEEEVLQALESCCHGSDGTSPPDDLLYVLNCSEVDLPQFLALTSSDQVIHLFRKHVVHMDTVTKTRLVDALQRQHDFYVNRLQQELVVELLESTVGDELRMMKDILDEGGDFYNLHKLVFHDLDPEMYSKALSHIQKEGRHLAKQYDPGQAPMKIVSDVDDTLYGSAQGGRMGEKRLKHRCSYLLE